MKRLAFAVVLALLVAPVYTAAAKDSGPSTKPVVKAAPKVPAKAAPKAATTKKTAAPKPVLKVEAKKVSKAAVPASLPAKAIKKGPVKVEGEVEVSKEDTKVTKEPGSASEAGALITDIIIAFKGGKIWYAISLILMLLTFAMGLIKQDIPPKALPWIAAGLGMATNGVAAIVGGMVWWEAVVSGFFQGAAAAGFWSMIGKHILVSKKGKDDRAMARKIVKNGLKVKSTVDIEEKEE